jgi:hypothetical protein
MRRSPFAAVASLALLAACEPDGPPPPAAEGRAATPAGDVDAWRARLLRIAKSFPELGRVDEGARVAPTDCALPDLTGRGGPARPAARPTASDDAATHGGLKVYSVFAKDPKPYRALTDVAFSRARDEPMDVDGTEGCSQVLVKEAYEPVEVKKEDGAWVPVDGTKTPLHRIAPASKDGKRLGAGRRLGVFVMFRVDPKTQGTDDGWVYGTVSADATTVTSVGRVASCMACHAKAPHGRLFGLPK